MILATPLTIFKPRRNKGRRRNSSQRASRFLCRASYFRREAVTPGELAEIWERHVMALPRLVRCWRRKKD